MRDLEFDRLSQDGTHFVLRDSRGVEYKLPVTEELATAVRRGLQRSTTSTSQSNLTPRDIQAWIRSGLSIDDVVESTGLARDFVQRFAEPVLAEMDFVVQRARRIGMSVGRRTVTLDEAVADVCNRLEVPSEAVAWNCAREDDGCWRIQAEGEGRVLVEVTFRVTQGTITPTPESLELLDSQAAGVIPSHWDAQHPAARAAARQAPRQTVPQEPAPSSRQAEDERGDAESVAEQLTPEPVGSARHSSPPLFDDPTAIF